MKKRFLLLTALAASSAWAQQNTDISAEQFNSGDANAKLSTLGRQAAASGKRLVVTAPPHWHAQIAARIKAGGNADVVLKDGFYETVLVRIEEKAPEPAKPEPPKPAPPAQPEPPRAAPPARAQPEPAPAPPPPPVEEAPAPAPVAEPVVQTPPPAVETPPATTTATPVVEEAPAAEQVAAEPAVVDPNAPVMLVVSEPGDTMPVRASLEKRYNEGKRITEVLEPVSLRLADLIYTGEGAAVVVRRDGGRLLRFWLSGELNLNQIGIAKSGANKYEVRNETLK